MRRLITATAAAFLLAGAGTARADDCTRTLTAGGGSAELLTGSRAGVDVASLSASGRARHVDHPRAVSPTRVTRRELIMWRRGAIVASGRGVLVAHVGFPGARGVAAAESADGTITLLYASGSTAVIRRIARDGSAGPATVVATAIDREAPFAPLLAVDAQGTAFGVVPGAEAGVAVRWPAAAAPQLLPSEALEQDADGLTVPAVKPDGKGGAWLLVNQFAIAHVDAAGLTANRLPQTALWVAAPAVDPAGDAVLAWSGAHRASVRHLTSAGVFGAATVLPSRDVFAVALDPRTGDPWVFAVVNTGFVLQTPGRTIPIRAPRHWQASRGELAIEPSGRAWVALERSCHDPVRVTSLRLNP